MAKKHSLSVVLPAYNEQENIGIILEEVYRYLVKHFTDFEIIVVNDGSRDKTVEVVKKFQNRHSQVKLINHTRNKGYGAALTSGFTRAKCNLVFYTDADCQFNITDLDKLLPLIEQYDIVAGYRLNRQDPLMRIFIAFIYNLIIRFYLGVKIRDVDCSFKLYKKEVFDSIVLTSQTGLIDAEVLLKARRKGFTIGQIGVRHYPRVRGTTMYEVGKRNKFFAWVRPQVVVDLLMEMKQLKDQNQ